MFFTTYNDPSIVSVTSSVDDMSYVYLGRNDGKILRVDEISKSSAGRSICRINTDIMREIGVSAGDIVEIIGKKTSPAIVFPSSKDRGTNIIRIDGLMRLNTGSTVGEYVKIRKAEVLQAKYVRLSYTQAGIHITGGIPQVIG